MVYVLSDMQFGHLLGILLGFALKSLRRAPVTTHVQIVISIDVLNTVCWPNPSPTGFE